MLLRFAILAQLLLSQPVQANDEARQRLDQASDRTRQEATALIETVIRDQVPDQQRCIFAKQWSNRAVDVTLARDYLGSRLYADVIAPHTGTAPADIIDPTGLRPDRFCSDGEANELWSQRLTSFANGTLPAENEEGVRQPAISMRRVDLSMPVFDPDYSTAVVVVSSMRRAATKREQDKVRQSVPEGFGHSLVHRREGGAWKQIHFTLDYAAN